MNKLRKTFSFEERKIQASILLKSLNSAYNKIRIKAVKRFLHLPEFTELRLETTPVQSIKHMIDKNRYTSL